MTARETPTFRAESATNRHTFGEVWATQPTAPAPLNGVWRQTGPHSRLPDTEGRSRLRVPDPGGAKSAGDGRAQAARRLRRRSASRMRRRTSRPMRCRLAASIRQCDGVRKPIGAVGAHSVETAMLKVVDCRLDRRVLAPLPRQMLALARARARPLKADPCAAAH